MLSVLGTRPKVAFRTRSVEAVRSLVATGAGVALLPDLVYRPWSLEGDRIEARDVSGSLPVVQVGLVWRKGSKLSAAAREFVAVAQAHRMIGDNVTLMVSEKPICILTIEFANAAGIPHVCRTPGKNAGSNPQGRLE